MRPGIDKTSLACDTMLRRKRLGVGRQPPTWCGHLQKAPTSPTQGQRAAWGGAATRQWLPSAKMRHISSIRPTRRRSIGPRLLKKLNGERKSYLFLDFSYLKKSNPSSLDVTTQPLLIFSRAFGLPDSTADLSVVVYSRSTPSSPIDG